jgi:CheY-like chemotaxis protein
LLPGGRQSPSRRFFLDQKTSTMTPTRQKALLVDRDGASIEQIKGRLVTLGFDVSVVTSGRACLQRLRRSSIDVLVLGTNVISESEPEVIDGIRKVRLKPSGIIATLGGDESVRQQLDIPHDLHLSEPEDVNELIEWVRGDWFCSCF